VLEHPEYYSLRERLIGFLESQVHGEPTPAPMPATPPDPAAQAASAAA
jgi:hypothetical protein